MELSLRISLLLLYCLLVLITCQNQTQTQTQTQTATPVFDKQIAFSYLEKQCSFGPRIPGTEGHINTRDFLVEELKKYTDKVRIQSFPAVNYMSNKRTQAYNIIASFSDGIAQVILCAHWDSRPKADQDTEPGNQGKPILGANDAASGVAVLLEIARIFSNNPPPFPVDIVFFDAEDMGRSSHSDEFLQGSRFFAKNKAFNYKPRAAILLDMVGDADLEIYIEGNSQNYAPDLVNQVWTKAEELNLPEFIREVRYTITDDHLPLLQAGIPAIDIIDYDYPYWHTTEDTPDKCSPESLEKVGRVLLAFVYQ